MAKTQRQQSAPVPGENQAPAAPQAGPWRNRIIGYGEEAPDKLLANPLNFRRHPKGQQKAMSGTLATLGIVQNVIVNKRTGHMIDGHLRVELALRERQPKVPITYVDLSDDEEKLALATFDPISGMAAIDHEQMQELLAAIPDQGAALKGLFDHLNKTAKGILETERQGNTGDDKLPGNSRALTARKGDVWILGDHRLAVGDCADRLRLAALFKGDTAAALMLTDPPYNVAYNGSAGAIQNDDMGDAQFLEFLTERFKACGEHCRPGTGFYVFHAAETPNDAFYRSLFAAGFERHQTLIWGKTTATLSRSDYNWRHEPIAYGWRPGAAHYFAFDYTETTLVDDADALEALGKKELLELLKSLLRNEAASSIVYEDKPSRSVDHPTMKPVALLQKFIANSTRRGELVLDPFGGSGSTLIACAKVGRRARMVELDEKFADVIIRRWIEWSGGEPAVLQDSGQTFEQAAAERKATA